MTAIRIEDFGGKIPRRSIRLLPQNAAQIATDCKLFSGELRGWNAPLLKKNLAGTGIKTVYRIPGVDVADVWFESVFDNVHFEKGTLVNDIHERYYWTSGTDDIPRMSTKDRIDADDSPYRLGAPPPLTAPTGVVTGGISTLIVTRVFVYTFVSAFGEESAPSPPLVLTGPVDASWDLTDLEVETDIPDYFDRNFAGGTKRMYRTITSVSGQTNFFLAPEATTENLEIPINQTTWSTIETDDIVALNSLLESSSWNEPPPELEGIVEHPNGFLVGFVGRDIYFSVPYRPHAWPAKYVLSSDYEIMGLGVVGNTVGIATRSNPYGCTGIHPEAMSLHKSNTVEPCLSKKGVVTLPTGIMYPSNNGLAWLTPAGAQVITQQFMTKEEWQTQFKPESINAARYETRYMAFNTDLSGFVYDPTESKIAVVDITRTSAIADVYTDPYTGLVNLVASDRVFEWDPSTNTIPITYTWKSRVFEFPKPINMGAGIVKLNDSEFTSDQDYIDLVTQVNQIIALTIPPLAAINNIGFNGVRRPEFGATYLVDLQSVGQHQSGAFNGNDLINVAELIANVPVVTVVIYAAGNEVYRKQVGNREMFRLPTGFKAHTYEIELISNTDIYSIAIAEVPKELRTV